MSRFFLLLILLYSGTPALADVSGLFNHTQGTYILIVQGVPGNLDATKLFDLLDVESDDLGSTLQKTASYRDFAGIDSFSMTCKISKLISDYGSCTITIKDSPNAHVEDSASRRYLSYSVTTNVEGIARLFKTPTSTAIFYRSGDNKLDLSNSISPDPRNFALVFVEKKQATH